MSLYQGTFLDMLEDRDDIVYHIDYFNMPYIVAFVFPPQHVEARMTLSLDMMANLDIMLATLTHTLPHISHALRQF